MKKERETRLRLLHAVDDDDDDVRECTHAKIELKGKVK
jgi:hypothetical protein